MNIGNNYTFSYFNNGNNDVATRKSYGVKNNSEAMLKFNFYSDKEDRFHKSCTDAEIEKSEVYDRKLIKRTLDQINNMETDNSQKSTNESEDKEKDESGTDSRIIVKPDGSRVLLITSIVGGIETTMSIELSKPNEWDSIKQEDGLPSEKSEISGSSGQSTNALSLPNIESEVNTISGFL